MTDTPFESGTLAARIYAALSPHYEGLMGTTDQSSYVGGYWFDVIYNEHASLVIKVFTNDAITARVTAADQGTVFALLAEVVNGGETT